MTLTDLERLTRAAIDALERTRRGELDQMALLDARSVELVSVHGKHILAMIAVIEAAKRMEPESTNTAITIRSLLTAARDTPAKR